jgi:hypothetical protein
MKEEINETLLNEADELINRPDREIMALSLGKNDRHADNYQMAITIKLRETLHTLNNNIIKLKKSTDFSSLIMIIMAFLILILTAVLVFK